MFRTTLKNLAARKLRLFTTSLAVLLGVAFMAGTMVLTDTIGRTFDQLFADVNAGTDAYVRGESAFSARTGDQRPRLDAGVVATIAAVDGVAVAEPAVEGYAQIVDVDGEVVGSPNGAPTFGANWLVDERLNPFAIEVGRPPRVDRDVVIDKATAQVAGLAVGQTTTVLTQAGPQSVEISGIATFGEADGPGGASFALFTLDAAQRYLTEPGKVDAVKVVAEPGVSQGELVRRIEQVVPQATEVLTGAQITAEDQGDIKDDMGFFATFMLGFAAIALFVGAFIISNTFSILVAQRSRETALMRALGASRRQVLGSVLAEAVVVGAMASAAGVAAGVGVAALLKSLLSAMGIDVPAGGVVLSGNTVIVSAVAGLGVSVASAVLPARRAARVPPIAAMRDVAIDTSAGSRRRVIAGAGVAGTGAAAMVVGLAAAILALIALGAALVFAGVAVLGPVLARPLSRVIGAPLPRLRGVAGTLARENAMRNPKRTSATAAALMIGVALVGFISILASSTKASIDASIDRAFTGDLVVESGSFGFGGLSPELATKLAELPEVATAVGVRTAPVEIDGSSTMVLSADPTAASAIADLAVSQGSLADLGVSQIAVHEDTAEEEGLRLGDAVSVRFAETGIQELAVAAIYGEDAFAGEWFIGLPAYEANVADRFDVRILLATAEGIGASEAATAVRAVTAAYPQADVQNRAEFKAAQGAGVDQMLNLIYALLGLAVFIALLGIANTLALSIFERTRELGLLRAVGMTRRQLRSMVRWEAVIIALLGTSLGLMIGTGFGWSIVQALRSEGLDTFTLPGARLATVTVIAAVAGVAAAILPARRAARLDVLRAVVSE